MNIKLVAIVVVILALVGGVLYIQRTTRNEVLREVKDGQDRAINNSTDARGGFDSCPDGMWDYGASRCRGRK